MAGRPVDVRIAALRRFATGITVLTVLGHTVLGFEPSPAYVLVALATAYSVELVFETVDAWATGRAARYRGGPIALVDFLLPAHISGLAIAMLLYSNERLWPIAFAVAVAMGSKWIFRVRTARGIRHFFNPSNAGIAVTLVTLPWVSIAPPYHFTENIAGAWDWALPGLLMVIGLALNARYTRKLPLIAAWLGGFALQAVARSWLLDTPLAAPLAPMTGLAFLLFTFYMVTDPGTTPFRPRAQVAFGLSVAAVYGLVTSAHVVFGLFFALSLVCAVRGTYMFLESRSLVPALAPAPEAALGRKP